MHLRRPATLLALALCAFTGPLHAQRERLPPEDREIVEKRWPDAQRTSTSIRYLVLKPGDGNSGTPKAGMYVSVLFKGELLNGTVFDQKLDPNDPFRVRIGRGGLIDGWEQIIPQMHRGEKRLIVVPYELGYGTRGRAPDIPRCATLVFEIELLDFGESARPKGA